MIVRILIAVIMPIITWTAHAEYMAKFPLESTQGGSLPSGSINISNNNGSSTPQEPEEKFECKYATGSSATQWRIQINGTGVSRIYWEGVTLTLSGSDPNTYIHTDGVKYIKGTLQLTSPPFNYFELCRAITN